MISLAIALLLLPQNAPAVPAPPAAPAGTATAQTQGQPASAQRQQAPPTPKPYSGPHTLAKTWGDLYPGLRTPAKASHASGATSLETPKAAGTAAATGKPATPSAAGAPNAHGASKETAVAGANAGKALPPPSAGAAASARPVTTTDAAAAPSSQLTFYNGTNKSGDGRVDVMHFRDGKMAVTMGKDWNCSYANDSQQHRVVIICDGARAHP